MLLDLITRVTVGEGNKPHYAVSSTLILLIRLRRKLLPRHFMIENLGQSPSHNVTYQVSLPHKRAKLWLAL
jgi:hypothetical protein